MYGHNVSFSQRKTRKVFKPNVQKRTLVINGQKIRLNVSTSALRTLRKKGLIAKPGAKAPVEKKAETKPVAKPAAKPTAKTPAKKA